MLEDLKNDRLILALICVALSLLVGLAIAPYVIVKKAYTIGGALATGGVVAWLVTRRNRQATEPKVRTVSVPAQLTDASCTDTFLVINILRPELLAADESVFGLLASIRRFVEDGNRLERIHDSNPITPGASYWTLEDASNCIRAKFIEVPIALGARRESPATITPVLDGFRLAANPRSDFFRGLFTGRIPQHPRLKGVILSCPLAPPKGEESSAFLDARLSAAIKELKAIGLVMDAHFPLYVVASGLELIEGFREFAKAVSLRFGDRGLEQAIGTAVTDPAGRETLPVRIDDAVRTCFTWRPALLDSLESFLNEQLDRAVDAQMREKLQGDAVLAKVLTCEFIRALKLYEGSLASFCSRIEAASAGSGFGSLLRGVFFSGLILPQPEEGAGTVFEIDLASTRRIFMWDLIANRLVADPSSSGVAR